MLQWHRRDEEAFGLFKSHRHRVGPRQRFWVALQEVSERFQNLCAVGKKTAVKVYHAQETLQLLDNLRGGTLFDCGSLLRRGGGAFRRNRVAKEFQGGDSKNTFFQIDGHWRQELRKTFPGGQGVFVDLETRLWSRPCRQTFPRSLQLFCPSFFGKSVPRWTVQKE